MRIRTIFGVIGNRSITFLTMAAAQDYVFENDPEYFVGKDEFYERCEDMIWEQKVYIK